MQAEGCSHIVRFVEALYQGTDSWLVFLDEGLSLHQLMYAPDEGCRAAAGMPTDASRSAGSRSGQPEDQQGPSDRWAAGSYLHLEIVGEVAFAVPNRRARTESAQAVCGADSHTQLPGGQRLQVGLRGWASLLAAAAAPAQAACSTGSHRQLHERSDRRAAMIECGE